MKTRKLTESKRVSFVIWLAVGSTENAGLNSIPTAPTNHLPDWSGLKWYAEGKGDKLIPTIRFVRSFPAARATTGFKSFLKRSFGCAERIVQSEFPGAKRGPKVQGWYGPLERESPVLAPCLAATKASF